MKNSNAFIRFALIALMTTLSCSINSQISITTLPYSPAVTNFDTYNPTNRPNALATIPQGWTFSSTGTEAFNGQNITGPANGGYYGYTFLLSGDYNLGAQRDATVGDITYHVDYVNNTGGLITSLVLAWDYEQWRFANVSGFSCFGTGALAGNAVLPTKGYVGANFSLLNTATSSPLASFTLSGLSIANGAIFGISWVTNDDAGADNGVALDNFSIVANATPSITLSNATIPAGNIYQTSTENVLYRTDVAVAVSPATLSSAVFNTTGNYLSSNLSNLKLWYSTNSVFSTGTSTLLSSMTTGLGSGAKTFSGLSQRFPLGTGYLFFTTDVPCSTTFGNVISVSTMSTSNFVFTTGNKFGSGFTAGGSQTIAPMGITAVSNRTICSGKSVTAVNFTTQPSGLTLSWTNNNTNIGLAASGSGNISSYVAPDVASNQTGNITVTPSKGACTGSNIGFSIIIKNNNQTSSAWTGGASSDWHNADNWSNCVCGSATDATISSGSFNPQIINNSANVRNITLSSGSSLSLQNSQALVVSGNWVNNGTFNAGTGAVVLAGSTAQNISGSASTPFYDLVLNNSAGASLSSAQEIRGTLLLNSGVFNTNNLLTLAASSTQSGRIGPIDPSADIINNVNVQQYAPGGTTGWALIGSPLSSALSMSDWNDDFSITCLSCPNGYYNFPSIYSYEESIPGDYSNPAKYLPITSINDNIASGKGYWVYLGNGSVNTSAIQFDVVGKVAKSSCQSCTSTVTIPLKYTSNSDVNNDGWNLISNPLPSPISWTALRNGNTDVDDAIYVYNTDLNSGQGGYASFVNGVSSHTTGGVNDNIAMCQGFYVHTRNTTTLTAGENIKTDSNPVFLKSAPKQILRLAMKTQGADDITSFYFEQGGSKSFQPAFDAYKINFYPVPYLGSMSDSVLTSISGLPELNSNITVPVMAITPSTGSFTFSTIQDNFPEGVCVTLYDSYTGTSTNILTNEYVCTLYDSTTTSRFTLSFYTTPVSGTTQILSKPVCGKVNGGMLSALGSGTGPWNYEWKSGDSIVKTSLNKSTPDSLFSLTGGNYSVKISNVGGCEQFSKTIILEEVITPTASFTPDVFTTSSSKSGQVNFSNQSSGSLINSWNFGDNSGTWFIPNPVYNYSSPGTYTVTLITQSKSNCLDTAQHVITVVDDLTVGLSSLQSSNGIRLLSFSQSNYGLGFNFDQSQDVIVRVFDSKGSLVDESSLMNVSQTEYSINLDSSSPGIYFIKVSGGSQELRTFKVVKG